MTRPTGHVFKNLFALGVIALICQPAQAQDSAPQDSEAQEGEATSAESHQSGYENIAEFGGPDSVGNELKRNDAAREPRYQFDALQTSLGPYFDWKRRVIEDRGVAFGTSLYLLYQKASDALPGQDDDALGHIFRYQGTWDIFKRDNGNSGRMAWRLESRSHIGGFQAPGSLGGATGIRTLAPGFAYNQKFEFDIPVLSWIQHFANGRAGYAVGRLAFDVYLDAFPFQTLSGGFINRSSIYNPTLPTTGLGAIAGVVKGFVTDNIWLGAQIYDANAVNGDFDLSTLEEGEWIKAVEIGFTPSFAERGSNRLQFTYWEKDARVRAGIPKGDGWAVSVASQLSDNVLSFVRFGHSNGGGGVAAEDAISAGLQFTQSFDETWTVGVGWANPSSTTFEPGLDDEFLIETSYKFQLSRNFSLTPDLQLVVNPAGNPDENFIWIFGIRAILTL